MRAHRTAVIRLPLRAPGEAGVISLIFICTLPGAGAKARPHVPTVRSVEVAPGVADQARTGRSAAASQDLVRAEPGLGILLVGIGDEAWIGLKVARGPLPYIADHLAAAEGAVPGR